MRTQERHDVYQQITRQIITAIEHGTGTWRMPWHHDGSAIFRPQNVGSHRAYRGVNILMLWIAAQTGGYGSGLWGTYRQWQAVGAQVRKGEKATTVVLCKEIRSRHDDEGDGEDDHSRRRLIARAYSVFNIAQVEGYEPEPAARLPESVRLAHAEAFLAALNIATIEGAYDAHYRIDLDRIFMPPFANFDDAESHIATLVHEAAHATGAVHRLDRDLTGRFGSAAYAAEELVAELTAGFVLADLGVAHQPRADHAAYVASWLRVLQDDPRAIVTAASKAQQAADWMHEQQAEAATTASAA